MNVIKNNKIFVNVNNYYNEKMCVSENGNIENENVENENVENGNVENGNVENENVENGNIENGNVENAIENDILHNFNNVYMYFNYNTKFKILLKGKMFESVLSYIQLNNTF